MIIRSKHPQDLHIHTKFSVNDPVIVPEQTVELVSKVRHAEVIGISDHFEYLGGKNFDIYCNELKRFGFHIGTEIGTPEETVEAARMPFEYYIFHCKDEDKCYKALEILIATEKPVIVAHPMIMNTNLSRVPEECLIEINNRYVWKGNWKKHLLPYINKYRFIISSDAHQPNWLNQNTARYVASELGMKETLLFQEDRLQEITGKGVDDGKL